MGFLLLPILVPLAALMSRSAISAKGLEPPKRSRLVLFSLLSFILGSVLLAAEELIVSGVPGRTQTFAQMDLPFGSARTMAGIFIWLWVFVSWMIAHSLMLFWALKDPDRTSSLRLYIIVSLAASPPFLVFWWLNINAPGT